MMKLSCALAATAVVVEAAQFGDIRKRADPKAAAGGAADWGDTETTLSEAAEKALDAMNAVKAASAVVLATEAKVKKADLLQSNWANKARYAVDAAAVDAARSAVTADAEIRNKGLSADTGKDKAKKPAKAALMEMVERKKAEILANAGVAGSAGPVMAGGIGGMMMQPDDFVGLTFMLATAIMLASTIYFFVERFNISKAWQPAVTVAGCVTGVAFWNYVYMRQTWLGSHTSPLTYRYCDWFVSVPLQVLEFFLILNAGGLGTMQIFANLTGATLIMMVFGYLGQAYVLSPIVAFVISLLAWVYIVAYVFEGAAGRALMDKRAKASHIQAFTTIRLIVTIGWLIYPLGYMVGFGWFNFLFKVPTTSYTYMQGPPAIEIAWLNGIYNVADLVNKTIFGLAILNAAKSEDQMNNITGQDMAGVQA